MNQPGGFVEKDGRIVAIHPWQVFFNHAAIYEMPHMILAAYMVAGFGVAGVYAVGILRGRRDRYHYTGFSLGFVPAAVLTPFQIFVGDTAARAIAHDQPVKFAAMEYVAPHLQERARMARRRRHRRPHLRRPEDPVPGLPARRLYARVPRSPAGTASQPPTGRQSSG